jgi:hypothetical protein
MKKIAFSCFILSVLSIASCNNSNGKRREDKPKEFPKPGTVVATAEMPITNDPLNKFTFSIKVIADSNIKSGVYDVDADYGPNFAEGQFNMPKGGEHLVPIIRKGSAPYTYVIGFKLAADTTFYDYFEVSSNRSTTKMQYLKAYTF